MEEGGLFFLKHIIFHMDSVRTRLFVVREVKAASAPSMTYIHLSDLS